MRAESLRDTSDSIRPDQIPNNEGAAIHYYDFSRVAMSAKRQKFLRFSKLDVSRFFQSGGLLQSYIKARSAIKRRASVGAAAFWSLSK